MGLFVRVLHPSNIKSYFRYRLVTSTSGRAEQPICNKPRNVFICWGPATSKVILGTDPWHRVCDVCGDLVKTTQGYLQVNIKALVEASPVIDAHVNVLGIGWDRKSHIMKRVCCTNLWKCALMATLFSYTKVILADWATDPMTPVPSISFFSLSLKENALSTSNVISGGVPTCNSGHSWETRPPAPWIMPSARLGSNKHQF